MNNPLQPILLPFLEQGLETQNQNIKLLLYKLNSDIFDYLDFESETIYQEPLFFSYFNKSDSSIVQLEQILAGFSCDNKFLVQTDDFGRLYIPNIGWFITNKNNTGLVFYKKEMLLEKDGIKVDFTLESFSLIENTSIEILKYPIPLLEQCFFNVDKKLIEVEIKEITEKHLLHLTKAYQLIKKIIPTQFQLLEKYANKCMIFNVDTYERNSFATMKAAGIGFYNAYQEDYDEVFFVDDIAHQTGHVIFYTLLSNVEDFFKVPKETILETLELSDGTFIEKRDLYVLFHAFYTYYTSLTCLDACLDAGDFDKRQIHEAKGRIAFYINKCYKDLTLIDEEPFKSEENAAKYFTEEGLTIYKEIKNTLLKISKKWLDEIKAFNFSNQPYNFTYSKFTELNPLT
ncbi:hypothetical protein [Chryseobacterium sp. SG20098]|uniref:hypothetical protein n=1 Tax=Chryseobacterium sp. SG20098 TaxID=3074145 RepID=UPI002882E202|nr:hypothetical protein [Chryseobacterium sp. SG20098]WNI37305.1 hypothetical protein RHP76_02310 [Chryseobacterium sp. SG20098]